MFREWEGEDGQIISLEKEYKRWGNGIVGHWNKYSGEEGLVWLMAACTTGLLVRRTQVSADGRTVSITELKKTLKKTMRAS